MVLYLTLFVPVFFYSHFSVRARDLKCFDFLNNVETNLVKLFIC